MNLHPRALEQRANPERHTFTIHNIYTGNSEVVTLARETDWYYVVWVKIPSNGRFVERRFHKATMCIDELNLYIEDTEELKTKARAEVAAKLEHLKTLEDTETVNEEVTPTDEQLTTAVDKVFSADLQDKPSFCPVCESYVKHDEMIFNPHAASVVCIDCDNELDTEHRTVIATIKSVAVMNYNGGHLAGFNFTPTLRHLPRMLVAFTPNAGGMVDSPNEMIRRLGYSCVNASRDNAVRVVYDDTGAYVVHGGFNELEQALTAIINGD